jgi:urea carboxylase
MWNRIRPADPDRPWLLDFFDQIRFFPVTEKELLAFREDFPRGRAKLSIEPTTFRLADYQAFLLENRDSIAVFKAKQQAAFEAERDRWAALAPPPAEAEPEREPPPAFVLAPGETAVRSLVAGSVWQVTVREGDRVSAGDQLVVLETMKMETVVAAPRGGRVKSVCCEQGTIAAPGTPLVVLAE